MSVWLTGLSGSGKSTVAASVLAELGGRGRSARVIDGDDLREGLNADLGFSREDRLENVRRVGEVALLFAKAGFVCLVTVISPYRSARAAVRERHRAEGLPFFEVHVATPLSICEARDPKGLYARARSGEIPAFTGVSDPYEPPERPDLILVANGESPGRSAGRVVAMLEAAGVLH